jgi:hypothetical protein
VDTQRPPAATTLPSHDNLMDKTLLNELGVETSAGSALSGYVLECLRVYEEALRAMGRIDPQPVVRSVDGSEVTYNNPEVTTDAYADVSVDY